jgi:hypothetical protein
MVMTATGAMDVANSSLSRSASSTARATVRSSISDLEKRKSTFILLGGHEAAGIASAAGCNGRSYGPGWYWAAAWPTSRFISG